MKGFAENIKTFFFELYGDVKHEKGDALNEYIREIAEGLGLKGWVNPTRHGTIEGYLEGHIAELDKFKNYFLPAECKAAKLERAVFGFEEPIEEYSIFGFVVKEENERPISTRVFTDYTPMFDNPLEESGSEDG